MTAHLDLRLPSGLGSCVNARLKISIQQDTDLPDPTGPRNPLKKESSPQPSL